MRSIEDVNSSTLRFRMPRFKAEDETSENINDANIWFAKMFPQSAKLFGPGFLQATYDDIQGLTRFIPAELNIDAFAHALGGDKRLVHRVVFYVPEETFYFNDPLIDVFCPTTVEKQKALISNFLIRCSEDCGSLVDIRPLVVEFRKSGILERVIERAKALHAADRSFFEGANGHRRMINGKIVDANAEPSYISFVKKGIIREPEGKLTIGNAFHRYYEFCKRQGEKPLKRQEFKHLVAEVIREEFRVGLRHDIVDDRGKAQHGWRGIDCRLDPIVPAGLN